MKIEENLQELNDLLDQAWSLPLVKGKAFIDLDQIKEILIKIKEALPDEFIQAKTIVADRSQIISEAKSEAESIVMAAKSKAEIILSKDEIVKQAELKAEKIITDAKNNAKNIKRTTNDYIENLIKSTDKMLMNNITEFRNACHDIRATYAG